MNFDDTEYPISDVVPIPTADFLPDDKPTLTPLQTVSVKWEPVILTNFKLGNSNSNNGQRAVYCAPVKEIPKEMDEESIKENRRKKNCEAARISRRKKKEYVSGLENRVIALERENKVLQAEIRKIKEMYCQNPALNQPQ